MILTRRRARDVTATEPSAALPRRVHLWTWDEKDPAATSRTLCGAPEQPHPECGPPWPTSIAAAGQWPYCPKCYRPICSDCQAIANRRPDLLRTSR